MTPRQCRAARALLGWKQSILAHRAGVGLSTVAQFEAGNWRTYPRNIEAMEKALNHAGIRFVKTYGVLAS